MNAKQYPALSIKTYTLTPAEAAIYDAGDDERTTRLLTDLRIRFGRIATGCQPTTEVRHPDGYTVEFYRAP